MTRAPGRKKSHNGDGDARLGHAGEHASIRLQFQLYFGAASQITYLFWLYRPSARPVGVYVLAAPPCGVHKRLIAALPMYP
jgi:hypothetical protein